MRICCGFGKKAKKVDDVVSYKKLRKHIASLHPVDPTSQEKFKLTDSVTVNKYGYKLADACYCLALLNLSKKCQRKCYAWCFKKHKKNIEKPDSMKDVPDSASDSDDQLDSF